MSQRTPDPDQARTDVEAWLPPPRQTRGRYDWVAISAQLRARPMQWALIFERDKASIAVAVQQGSVSTFHPDDGIEVRTRNNTRGPNRTCSMYARFNPDRVRR